ncbi:MAG: CHASE domain-containing protein [Spirochaetota bacterium]
MKLLPWVILAVTLGVTWLTWDHERQSSREALRTQFGFALRDTINRVEQGVKGYELILSGVQSLFATTPLRNLAAMNAYMNTLKLDANFAGIRTIGLLQWDPSRQDAPLLGYMRSSGFSETAGQAEVRREGEAGSTRQDTPGGQGGVFPGSDIWLDPVRRAALQKARDSGMATISGKVSLKADTEPGPAPDFIMYLPVFAQGQSHDTVEQRRAQLLGWVYAAFNMDDFMSSLYGSQPLGISVALYDGTEALEEALLVRMDGSASREEGSRPGTISADEYMVVASHNWLLSMRTLEEFEVHYGKGIETAIAAAGTGLSLLLALLVWLLNYGRDRALLLEENRGRNEKLNIVLKEVHHRIKNNMNNMTSLLSLQSERITDPAAIAALDDAGERMQSMSVLYDKLYQSSSFQEMSLGTYLPSLIDAIVANYAGLVSVKVEKNIEAIVLDAQRVQSLGIMINELLTNSMKYAFPRGSEGVIRVSAVLRKGRVVVSVEDNGKGMPVSVDLDNTTGFGMSLVKGLAKQLQAKIALTRGEGTRIVLDFKL